jgi:hypothetical protein
LLAASLACMVWQDLDHYICNTSLKVKFSTL